MGDPWAIRRYKAQEQTYYDRDKALKDQVTEAARTSWYEKANRQVCTDHINNASIRFSARVCC